MSNVTTKVSFIWQEFDLNFMHKKELNDNIMVPLT